MPEFLTDRGRPSFVRTARRAALAAAAAAVLLLFPAQAIASHLNSSLLVSIGDPIERVSGVYLTVPVEVTCPVLPAPLTAIASDQISVTVTQNTGTELAFGSGGTGYQSPVFNGLTFGTPVTCDGTAHSYTVNVFPSTPQSGPFHGGQAVASAFFSLDVYDPTNPCVYCTLDQNSASSGPQSIKIRG
jgi:hypothetical protein